jgi:hypothetical protein
MRSVMASLAVLLAPTIALAAPPEKFYFLGEVKLSNAAGKSMGSQVIPSSSNGPSSSGQTARPRNGRCA